MKRVPRKKNIAAILVLALVCIAAVELIACRINDPELFHKITAPVVDAAKAASNAVTSAAEDCAVRIGAAIDEVQQRREQKRLEKLRKEQETNQKGNKGDATAPEEVQRPTAELLSETQVSTEPLIPSSALMCDPSVTHVQDSGDLSLLTGGLIDVVYYDQKDARWENLFYGTDKISSHGCGPTAMAMVVSTMTDTVMDPVAMSEWAVTHGHWARGSGSYHSIVMGIASDFGLQSDSFQSRDPEDMREALLSGKLLVALMGPGHFTRGGHFIVLRGVTLSGDILVADPNSLGRSLAAWDAQLILDELSKSTASGSPLWLISAPGNGMLE